MKHSLIFPCIVAAAVVFAGCDDKPPISSGPATPPQEMKNGHPVVHVSPVETKPFEEGYNAGYDYGKGHAKPGDKLATEEEADKAARENSAGQPDRWERGFAQGYADGVRNIVTGRR